MSDQSPVEEWLKDIKRRTRRKFNAEEKLRIVLKGIKGGSSFAELCRRGERNPRHPVLYLEQRVPRRREETSGR